MKKVILEFTYHFDIISVPLEIANEIKIFQRMFDTWIYDKNNNHNYWVFHNGVKVAVSFNTEAFIDYLNKYHIEDSNKKAYIIESSKDLSQKDLYPNITTIYF